MRPFDVITFDYYGTGRGAGSVRHKARRRGTGVPELSRDISRPVPSTGGEICVTCEGLAAKDPASPYPGGRTMSWLKVKVPHYRESERGWEPERK